MTIIAILLAVLSASPALGSVLLCCHDHTDGTHGCVPWTPDTDPSHCESSILCPSGASRKDPDDECSWTCDGDLPGE